MHLDISTYIAKKNIRFAEIDMQFGTEWREYSNNYNTICTKNSGIGIFLVLY